jgi:hypothetical protein
MYLYVPFICETNVTVIIIDPLGEGLCLGHPTVSYLKEALIIITLFAYIHTLCTSKWLFCTNISYSWGTTED